MIANSLLREAMDPAQIPRGAERTPVGRRPRERSPLAVVVDRNFDLAAGGASLSDADVVVVRVEGEAALRSACAVVCRRARRGQTIVLAARGYLGATRQLLIDPLAELGFEIGVDICVACLPAPGSRRPLLGATGPACAARARRAIESIEPAVELTSSPEAAELAALLAELGPPGRLASS